MVRGDRKFYIILISLIALLLALNVFADSHDLDPEEDLTKETTDTDDVQTDDNLDADRPGDAFAEEETSFSNVNSYNWLESKTNETVLSIEEEVLAFIAFLDEGSRADTISVMMDHIKSRGENGCWPKGNCNTKDTALATLAMHLSGQTEEAEAGAKWVMDTRTSGLTAGEWWLVLKSTGTGSCEVNFAKKIVTYNIEEDKIKELPTTKYYAELARINNAALKALLPELLVDCTGLLGAIITLLYKPDSNTFFIQESESAAIANFKVANACFSDVQRSSKCDLDSSLYATWVLTEMDVDLEDIGTNIYLQNKIKPTDSKQLGLLNRILYRSGKSAPSFIVELAKMQKTDGSWEGDVYSTSIALFGLSGSDATEEVARAVAFLERKMDKEDGSFGNSVRNTAFALIALSGVDLSSLDVSEPDVSVFGDVGAGGSRENCEDSVDNDMDTKADCADLDCEDDLVILCNNNKQDTCEEEIDCGGFCNPCGETSEVPVEEEDECELDSDCGSDEECKSGSCVPLKEDDIGGGDVEEPSSLLWLWILLILLVLGGGFGLFYIKYVKTGKFSFKDLFKKKNKGPTFEEYKMQNQFRPVKPQAPSRPSGPVSRPSYPMRPMPSVKSKEEDALEKSIKEAQRIIKGK